MIEKKQRQSSEINASSMADIAFLLLIFFLVTTTIASDKGIAVLLPPKKDAQEEVEIHERNIFKISINSKDKMLVEEKPLDDLQLLKEQVMEFVLNEGRNPKLSDNPNKAVVSVKVDRGTTYELYIDLVDVLKTSYSQIRADYLGMSLADFDALDRKNPEHKKLLDEAKKKYPYQVSDAEPTNIESLR